MQTLDVLTVPAFDDNYLWLIRGPAAPSQAVAVDPGDAAAIEQALQQHQLQLAAILVTHHHGDHVGGVEALAARYGVPVYGPGNENIDGITHPLVAGDSVALPALGLQLAVLAMPGHTLGHLAYAGHGVVFCGDTLFSAGCGRLFEGTPAQMHSSLQQLAALPPATRVYCAHEYTQANLRFALAVEPDNAALQAHAATVATLRAQGTPSIPSTIAVERAINPFMRTTVPAVRASAAQFAGAIPANDIETLAALREWKNGFRG
jgi:hydroxyacylglutathione hydrolase